MEQRVFLIAATTVDWHTYIEVCQKILGYSPTRGLDDYKIDTKDAKAFLATLDLNNKPMDILRSKDHRAFEHMFISFIALANESILVDFAANTSIKILEKKNKRQILCLLSGSLSDWIQASLRLCVESTDAETREVMCQCIYCFDRIGLNDAWSHYERVYLQDKTFIFIGQ